MFQISYVFKLDQIFNIASADEESGHLGLVEAVCEIFKSKSIVERHTGYSEEDAGPVEHEPLISIFGVHSYKFHSVERFMIGVISVKHTFSKIES